MDIANRLIDTNGGLLTSLLIYKEFNFEQAVRFLPQAMSAVVKLVTYEGSVQLPSSDGAISLAKLMQKIDINLLAVNTSIDPVLAHAGITELLPKILELLGNGQHGSAAVRGDKTVWFDVKNGKTFCDD